VRKALQIGGIAAGVVLIGFGVAAIVLAIKGGNTEAARKRLRSP